MRTSPTTSFQLFLHRLDPSDSDEEGSVSTSHLRVPISSSGIRSAASLLSALQLPLPTEERACRIKRIKIPHSHHARQPTESTTYQPHWFTTAVVSGAVAGVRSTADAVVHVTRNLLEDPLGCAEEVGVVVVDGLIATAATLTPYPPESARASQERTVDRLRPFAEAYDAYTKAPLEQQVEMLSALGTTLVLPAGVAKGAKAVETLVQSQGPRMLRWIEETVRPHDGGFVYAAPVRLPVNNYERIRAGAATDRISFANAYDAGSGPRPLKPARTHHLDAAIEKSNTLFNRWMEELPPVQLPEGLPNTISSFLDQANYAMPGKVLGGCVEYVGENQSAIYFFRRLWTPMPYKAGGPNYSDRLKNVVEQIVKHSQEMGHREVYFLCPSRVPLPSVLVEQHYPVQAVGKLPLGRNPVGIRTPLNMMRVDVEKSSLPIAPLSAEGTLEKSRVLIDQWLKGFPDVPFSKGLPSVQLPEGLPNNLRSFLNQNYVLRGKVLGGTVEYVRENRNAIYFLKGLLPKKYPTGVSDYYERLTNVVERIVEHSQAMGDREVYFLCTSKTPLPSVLLEQRYPVQAVSEFPTGGTRLGHNGRLSIMRVDTERAPLRPPLVLESPVFEPEMSQISLPLGWKSSSKAAACADYQYLVPLRRVVPQRGEVYWVELDRIRPALVISDSRLNRSDAVTVLPITTKDKGLPFQVTEQINGKRATIKPDYITTVNKDQFKHRLTVLSEETMEKVEAALKDTLGFKKP